MDESGVKTPNFFFSGEGGGGNLVPIVFWLFGQRAAKERKTKLNGANINLISI